MTHRDKVVGKLIFSFTSTYFFMPTISKRTRLNIRYTQSGKTERYNLIISTKFKCKFSSSLELEHLSEHCAINLYSKVIKCLVDDFGFSFSSLSSEFLS